MNTFKLRFRYLLFYKCFQVKIALFPQKSTIQSHLYECTYYILRKMRDAINIKVKLFLFYTKTACREIHIMYLTLLFNKEYNVIQLNLKL